MRLRARLGFSLLELMTALAVVMVLAAIAIPSFRHVQLESKRSEGLVNTEGIRTAQLGYEAAHDAWVHAWGGGLPNAYIPSLVNEHLQDFPTGTAFDDLAWRPDGQVRCGYYTIPHDAGVLCSDGTSPTMEVWGKCDVDGDARAAFFVADNCRPAFFHQCTAPPHGPRDCF